MGSLFRILMDLPVLRSALKPISRLIVGLIAIPVFRFFMRRVFRLQDLDDELEKDLEEWFRGALLLLAATANMEHLLFGWLQKVDWLDRADWLTMGLRLLLAIGVIEAMPDQDLFAVLHPGPPKMEKGKNIFKQLWQKRWAVMKGHLCRHINRSSPVLAMMCAIVGSPLPHSVNFEEDAARHQIVACWACTHHLTSHCPVTTVVSEEAIRVIAPEVTREHERYNEYRRHRERWLVGWVCYLMAITQYLIIGLVTSRDRAMDVLSEFDRAVAARREELIQEFQLEGSLPDEIKKPPESAP